MSDFPPPALREAAEEVAAILRERKETISVAETAAGGLVSAALLATPGASKIYKGGLTLYTLESRIAFAGWTQADLDNYDGPTPKLVAGLAAHVRKTLKSTYTVGEACLVSSSMQPLKLIDNHRVVQPDRLPVETNLTDNRKSLPRGCSSA
jgi:nicotinamide mononucleotide (NMN) deamidase PncC